MAIEDVQYLLDNSEQDSTMVFIDSTMRNRAFYPTPSEYVVSFDEPLRLVFGMDVLDATIPGTMYNVDTHNNTVAMILVDTISSAALKEAGASDDAQRDAITTEMQLLGHSPQLRAWAQVGGSTIHAATMRRADAEAADLMVDGSVAVAPPSVGEVVHCVFVEHRIRGVPMLRFAHSSGSASAAATGSIVSGEYTYIPVDPSRSPDVAAVSITMPQGVCVCPSSLSWSSPEGLARGAIASSTMYDVVYYVPVRTTPTHLQGIKQSGMPRLYMTLHSIVLEEGNYTTSTLQLELQSEMLVRCGIDVLSTSRSTVDKQGKYRFVAASTNTRFIVNVAASTAASLMGFDLPASMQANSAGLSSRTYNAVPLGNDTRSMYMSVLRPDPVSGKVVQMLEAPGLASLLGERYITLRCREIEEHLCNVGKYGRQSTGIGVFKLANANEVAQLRFDFVSLIRRPFHPIGRLTRMTLRFERSDGSLYDFKGINHQLLLTIKYYRPSAKRGAFVSSVINPDYDPNYLAYMITQRRDTTRIQDRGYDDDDEAAHDEAAVAALSRAAQRQHYRNDYYANSSGDEDTSTTDDDNGDDDDSSDTD